MKKIIVALSLIIALLSTCLVGCQIAPPETSTDGNAENIANEELKLEAAAVFTLDVNPGVRIYVDENGTVIEVEATNADGEAVVSELSVEGVDFETVVEEIIDKMDEKGYLEGDASSVLISLEKEAIDISEQLNEKINQTFEKHGKKASVIEQELYKLDEKLNKEVDEIATKYNISKGKAHLIEKIREEFPELSEEELASLKVNDLGMMLDDTSEDVKDHFNKIGKAVEDAYVGRENALATALASLEITADDVTMQRVRVTREDGKMIYEVEFVYDGNEYEIAIDAASGEIIETEIEEHEEFDAKEFIDDFCKEHDIEPGKLKDKLIDKFYDEHRHTEGETFDLIEDVFEEFSDMIPEFPFDELPDGFIETRPEPLPEDHSEEFPEDRPEEFPEDHPEEFPEERPEERPEDFSKSEDDDEHIPSDDKAPHEKLDGNRPLSRGEILKNVLAELEISEEILKKTDVQVHKTESGTVATVTIETDSHDVYKLVVEAYSGVIIKADLNGQALEITVEIAE